VSYFKNLVLNLTFKYGVNDRILLLTKAKSTSVKLFNNKTGGFTVPFSMLPELVYYFNMLFHVGSVKF
jgi:hypothetical protein